MLALAICIVLLSSAAVAFFFYIRRPSPPKNWVGPRLPFSAVEISLGVGSCEAAKDLVGQQLLAQDAPAFPLAGCTHQCHCAWEKLRDRRQAHRRLADDELGEPIVFDDPDARFGDDRRS